jgi:hypothetical protein
MLWHADAIAVAQTRLDVEWQVAICRRLTGQSCTPNDGTPTPPTFVDLIDSLPAVPPIVAVEMGYNDFVDGFAEAVDASVQALVRRGVRHVLWLTLRAARDPYPALNRELRAAADRYPQLELVDWNAYAAGHPEWFQTDGVHLLDAGGVAMAHLIHRSVIELTSPLHVVPAALPRLRAGRAYNATLHAAGGTGPDRWRVVAGRPVAGLHLLADGRIYGRPRVTKPLNISVQVTDSEGLTAVQRVVVRVSGVA